ncbi:MAG TPA: AtpZ/AtpI family protein [Xanthobacteraceae bacterium]|jgi:ATP synthase protein I
MAADRPPDRGSRRARDADDVALDARLRRLSQRLGSLKPKPSKRDEAAKGLAENPSNLARALRLSSEFAAGIILGGFIGWLIDRLTGWSPWGMIVFLMLGFAAGTLNALRSAGLIAKQGMDQN